MLATAAAALRPVPLRRPGALLRAPVPRSLLDSRGAAPFPRRTASLKISQLQLTAARFSKESDSAEDDELLSELREKWDAMENKPSLLLYGGGAIFALWISFVVLPGLLELVGLGYSGWFVYRYLLFQENRKELANNFDALKKRITGDDE
ncbi:protein CURVATURE THYLAKOID 1A, chloroplastic-like isoform X2 [Panicum hallii]|uniref:protein CURVATURE THYLAKOID 1A, chloroplastic-like isoform X2 n=1 Tax=Panicum hallii TaxID=206008 RepID=UPI000DF4F177|nr:protein CURVATURE THYLAKOID 1A, chloroplastic-like isoform X2 [Panicum hallii]